MTSAADPGQSDYELQAAEEQRAADASYERALTAKPDKSADPQSPNYDAGLDTFRQAILDKTLEDPEDAVD